MWSKNKPEPRMILQDICAYDLLMSSHFQAAQPLVLLVDDHQQNLELLEAYLEELPARIDTAKDGIEALRKVKDGVASGAAPSLILLDVMMPKMSGFQVAQRLRDDATTRNIPVIMVTALGEVSDQERATDLGVKGFLTKPVNKNDLLEKVRTVLASR
jgi:two-component system, OmpR family, alkaline phosphatase synthesis response regulator PhoP